MTLKHVRTDEHPQFSYLGVPACMPAGMSDWLRKHVPDSDTG